MRKILQNHDLSVWLKAILALLVFILAGNQYSIAQNSPDSPFSLFLVGDAGKYSNIEENPALQALGKAILEKPNGAVLFLGDNIYNRGLDPLRDFDLSKAKIEVQLNLLRDYPGMAFFVPGNHDWQVGLRDGLKVLGYQAEYVDSFVLNHTQVHNRETGAFFPAAVGTPGPDTFRLAPGLLLLMLDSQWFLHRRLGKEVAMPDEGTLDEQEAGFWEEVRQILERAKASGDKVIMASHHPLFSVGTHGRKRQAADALNFLGRYNTQELYGKGYRGYRDYMTGLVNEFGGTVIYAAGHDHNLQYWYNTNGNHHIVSGAGSKKNPFYPSMEKRSWNQGADLVYPNEERYPGWSKKMKFPEDEIGRGHVRIDFWEDGSMEILICEVDREPVRVFPATD